MTMEDNELINENKDVSPTVHVDKKDCDSSEDDTSAMLQKIDSLKKEVELLRDTILRQAAESDNLRKRLVKEKGDAEKYANTRIARDLLSVIDNFERVTENSKDISEKINADKALKIFFDGVDLCGKEILVVFKKHGITVVEASEGDAFDPRHHQAMCEIESNEHNPGAIIKVFQNGYVYHDRLLRPAMVSVSKKT